jgi:hypothetical protein
MACCRTGERSIVAEARSVNRASVFFNDVSYDANLMRHDSGAAWARQSKMEHTRIGPGSVKRSEHGRAC